MSARLLALVLASAVLSMTAAYVCWVHVRIIRLVEDLFIIRDRLFLFAARAKGLHDPGYMAARERLNSAIRLAPQLSVPIIIFAAMRRDIELPEPPESEIPGLQKKIDLAHDEAMDRLTRYLFQETLMGLALRSIIYVIPYTPKLAQARRSVEPCFASPALARVPSFG